MFFDILTLVIAVLALLLSVFNTVFYLMKNRKKLTVEIVCSVVNLDRLDVETVFIHVLNCSDSPICISKIDIELNGECRSFGQRRFCLQRSGAEGTWHSDLLPQKLEPHGYFSGLLSTRTSQSDKRFLASGENYFARFYTDKGVIEKNLTISAFEVSKSLIELREPD